MRINLVKTVLAGIALIALARIVAVLAFVGFVSERSLAEEFHQGILASRLVGPGGWDVTLLLAGILLLLYLGIKRLRASSLREMLAGIAPVVGLLFLAPWIGEYLLGNVPLGGLVAIPFLVPLYGGGALLIRETVRRSGRGYPAILVQGLAYGVIEAGLVDQSLFNSSFQGHDFHTVTYIPWLGTGAFHAMAFIFGHAIWSIAIPIVIVELLTLKRRTTPWLGGKGLAATAALYLFGCWIIFQELQRTEGFLASPGQCIGAAALALVLIVLAFSCKERPAASSSRRAPKPWIVGASTFVLVNAFFFRPENWLGVVLGLVFLGAAAMLLRGWSRREGWSPWHQYAVVAATLPTYMFAGFVLTAVIRPDDMMAWIGNIIFACAAAALLVLVARRIRKCDSNQCIA